MDEFFAIMVVVFIFIVGSFVSCSYGQNALVNNMCKEAGYVEGIKEDTVFYCVMEDDDIRTLIPINQLMGKIND